MCVAVYVLCLCVCVYVRGCVSRLPEDYLSPNFADRANTEFKKLALRGVTIISTRFARVHTHTHTYAQTHNFTIVNLYVISTSAARTSGDLGVSDGVDCTKFHADFPSSSPYTTSLGATRLTNIPSVCHLSLFRSLFLSLFPFKFPNSHRYYTHKRFVTWKLR